MARIPEIELERLKRVVSLERLVEAKGVVLQRRGKDLVGRCPFHEDHGPSLVVTPTENLWHCLGACQAGGSVIDWVMRSEGVSFRHAVELLRADLPAGAISSQPPVKASTVRRLPAPVEQAAEDRELLKQVVAFYHETLRESPDALQYLESRGLRSKELLERFQLGYANRTLGLRLPQRNRIAGADLRGRLQRIGVIRESGHEHFNGSLVVPIFDAGGEVVEIYGRKLRDDLRPGTPLHLYLPGPHRGVWNLEGVGDEVIVTEALVDAMTFWVQGYRNVTAAYGVEGFTAEHEAAFLERGVRRVLIAYDADTAGDKAAVQLAVRLTAQGMDCFRVRFPKGEDANSFALTDLDSAQRRLGDAIRKAVWLGQGKRPADGPTPALSSPSPGGIVPAAADVIVPAKGSDSDPLSAAEPDESPPTTARIEPPSPPEPPTATVTEREVVIEFGDRRWRVRGLEKNTSFDVLKVNLLVSQGGAFYVDTLDLYQARSRQQFVKQAAAELQLEEETLKRDAGRLLLRLEELAEQAVRKAQEPVAKARTVSSEEEREALELLRDPRLFDRIVEDLDQVGVVGEETNKLVAYLAATSRKLDRPLAVIVQSTSAAGKSALMDAVLDLIPEEERIQFSAITGQALYYLGENDLEHKVLAIEEAQGAERAAYALKLLQSEGELSIASTGKDPGTGRLVTQEYRVKGPVAIFLTTTSVEVDEELLNRCIVLTVNEEREQTGRIHERQRREETLEGLVRRGERERVIQIHRNAQRLLRPLLVANPFARQLTFQSERTRSRRDHMKYLSLIRAVALLHQHQRPLRTADAGGRRIEFIEVTREDIVVANRLAHEVLGRSLDELPPGSRRLLLKLDEMVDDDCRRRGLERAEHRFSRRELREKLGWGDTQLKVHLARLLDQEYLTLHRSRTGAGFCYELCWDGRGRDGRPVLAGLTDPDHLDVMHDYDDGRSALNGDRSGSGRPPVGGVSAPVELGGQNALREDLAATVVGVERTA